MDKKKYLIIIICLVFSLGITWFGIVYFPKRTSSIEPVKPQEIVKNISEDSGSQVVSESPAVEVLPVPETPVIVSQNTTEIMAWIYPGEPACNARNEYDRVGMIDVLKTEYFKVEDNGDLTMLTEKKEGCNGYSVANIADLKKYSKDQYVTISSSYAKSMDLFLRNSLGKDDNINTIVTLVTNNDMTGVELDFEDFGGWTGDIYPHYKDFVARLGDALHKKGKKLMLDGPAISKQEEESWYPWRYKDIAALPVDHLVIMAYDYQFDNGAGKPIAPISWVKDVIQWTKTKVPDSTKITIGIPSYGYKGVSGGSKITILTYEQLKQEKGFDTATRDTESGEMTWKNGNNVYFYQDGRSMTAKRKAIESLGIASVSVWHLGGNPWFSK